MESRSRERAIKVNGAKEIMAARKMFEIVSSYGFKGSNMGDSLCVRSTVSQAHRL